MGAPFGALMKRSYFPLRKITCTVPRVWMFADIQACMDDQSTGFSSVHGADLKCEKGISWMPWRIEAMKDVTLCDKLRGAGSRL